MSQTIFYSWQSDIEPNKHRYFIERCLKTTLDKLEQKANIYMDYDRDTAGVNGSPDISQTIFEKIDKCILFVCDVSIINLACEGKKTPNPNVLIELGYAVNKLGWDRIICLFDNNTGKVEDLPFDIRQKRITVFNPEKGKAEEKRISEILTLNIKDLFMGGKLFNPLNDYMKGRIDRAIFDVTKQIGNLMFGTYSMSEGLSHVTDLLNLNYDIILERIPLCEFPGFILLNTYDTTESDLRDILKDLLSSSYFPKEWSYTVLELLEWIRDYRFYISKRNKQFPIEKTDKKSFPEIAVISAESVNKTNPPNSKIVLNTYDRSGKKYIDPHSGRVVNTTIYPDTPRELSDCYIVKPAEYKMMAERVFKLICICKQWSDENDNEFIFDPDYYIISS